MRKLASIQKIESLNPIVGADQIERAKVLGWNVVVRKGEFEPGDTCVYCEIDSLLPEDNDHFAFLKNEKGRIKRIKSKKIRGVLSQGIVFPTTILPDQVSLTVDTDVTETLGIEKYEPTDTGQALPRGNFPPFLIKTDETRIQSKPALLDELKGKPYVMTLKEDGTSATYYIYDGHFGMCSRNLELKSESAGKYSDIAEKYGIETWLHYTESNLAIQGEITGPGIQGNRVGRRTLHFSAFNVFDIDTGEYWGAEDSKLLLDNMGIPIVETFETGDAFNYTVDQLLELADAAVYSTGLKAEGLVIRPKEALKSEALYGDRLSFKAISNDYLLRNKL